MTLSELPIAQVNALPPRKKEQFLLLAEGLGPKEVMSKMNIKPGTYYVYCAFIKAHLGLTSMFQVRQLAMRIKAQVEADLKDSLKAYVDHHTFVEPS